MTGLSYDDMTKDQGPFINLHSFSGLCLSFAEDKRIYDQRHSTFPTVLVSLLPVLVWIVQMVLPLNVLMVMVLLFSVVIHIATS